MRKVIILALISLSFSFFAISRGAVQHNLVKDVVFPFSNEEYLVISFTAYPKDIDLKELLIEISNETKTDMIMSVLGEYTLKYYWNIHDQKYLDRIKTLNKPIDLNTFNMSDTFISSDENAQFHFNFINDNKTRELYNFSHVEEDIIRVDISLKESKNVDMFRAKLKDNHVEFVERVMSDPHYNLFSDYISAFKGTPQSFISIALVIISLYIIIYNSRRNISIYLINGQRKLRFSLDEIKKFLSLAIPVVSITFLLFQWINPTSIFHFGLILKSYMLLMMMMLITFSLLIVIITYSLSEATTESYLKGYSKQSLTSFFTLAFKMYLTFTLITVIFGAANMVYFSKSILLDGKNKANNHHDIYMIDDRNSSLDILRNSMQIVKNLKNEGVAYYITYEIDSEDFEYDSEGEIIPMKKGIKDKFVYANNDYIKNQHLLDEDNHKIEVFNEKSVYLTKDNYASLNNSELMNIEKNYNVVFISPESSIKPYTDNILSKGYTLTHDFILFERAMSDSAHLSYVLIDMSQSNEEVLKEAVIVETDLDSLDFINLGESYKNDYDISIFSLTWALQWIVAYGVIIVIISMIHFQVIFDRTKNEFAIYYANGINKLNRFYKEFLYQVLISVLLILIYRNSYYQQDNISYVIASVLVLISIDLFVVLMSTHKFYKEIVRNLKERN